MGKRLLQKSSRHSSLVYHMTIKPIESDDAFLTETGPERMEVVGSDLDCWRARL